MKKKLLGIVLGIFALAFLYFSVTFIGYFHRQNENKDMIEYCSQNNTDECHTRMLELMLPSLLIYDAEVNGKKLELIKIDNKYLRVVSKYALSCADALFGYGVFYNTVFEETYSELFDKYSYAFDCGLPGYSSKHEKCLFESDCISSDKYLIVGQPSSGKTHTLKKKLEELGFADKQVFVKMDIAGAELLAIPEIVKNAENITGFYVSLYIHTPQEIISKIKLLEDLNKDFVLVTREFVSSQNAHPELKEYGSNLGANSNYLIHKLTSRPYQIKLMYVNKKLLSNYKIMFSQNTANYYKRKNIVQDYIDKSIGKDYAVNDIHYIVVISEILKQYRQGILKKNY